MQFADHLKNALTGVADKSIPGLTIINVYLGQLVLPDDIRARFLELEYERLNYMLVGEKAKVAEAISAHSLQDALAAVCLFMTCEAFLKIFNALLKLVSLHIPDFSLCM